MNFNNNEIKGVHASRYIASWLNVVLGSKMYDFKDWLEKVQVDGENLSKEEIEHIWFLATNGKMELEHKIINHNN